MGRQRLSAIVRGGENRTPLRKRDTPAPPSRALRLHGVALGRVFGLAALLLLLLLPSAALAAPPANDDFADREVLSGSLPIEVTRSNVEATKEESAGEFIPGLAPAGHSVWFEWEATSTGWVTIGACVADFPTILAIFTGTEIDQLTQVVNGNASEGPDCPFSQRQYTFKTKSGTKYVIAVDGNSFNGPFPPNTDIDGEFMLGIESTLQPANDDFASATPLKGEISEEPGGNRFYFASTLGHNWTATTETGEQSYGAGSGASVWYSWTAPESGKYRIGGPCCGTGLNWSLYSGSSIGELTQILAATGSAEVTIPAGSSVRIAVWGTPDLATEEPTMASFSFSFSAQLPPLPSMPAVKAGEGSSPRDIEPPNTTIRKRVLKRMPPVWIFQFSSSEPGSTFRCKLDRQPYRRCSTGKRYTHLASGRHTLKAFAIDPAGNADSSPAVARFTFPAAPKPKSRH